MCRRKKRHRGRELKGAWTMIGSHEKGLSWTFTHWQQARSPYGRTAAPHTCCSIASCSIERAESLILSNSSMQQMPLSLSTSAPDSRTISLESGSRVTYAVRPTCHTSVGGSLF
eukprot:363427-Chlamydomonas_euryale.AAC.5